MVVAAFGEVAVVEEAVDVAHAEVEMVLVAVIAMILVVVQMVSTTIKEKTKENRNNENFTYLRNQLIMKMKSLIAVSHLELIFPNMTIFQFG